MTRLDDPEQRMNVMNVLKNRWNDLAWRKRSVMFVSGLSILVALFLDHGLAQKEASDVFMVMAAVVAGTDIAARAISALRRKQITIELLVTIAATGALVIGEYWESAAVTFLFVFGAWLEARTLGRTRASLANLIELAPATALVLVGDRLVETPLDDIEIHDLVVVRAGESIPVDGKVISGTASINESAITGEPVPVTKSVGDSVFTGTVSTDASLTIETQSVGADSMLGRIVARVEEAQEAKAPVQTTIERFARWYTPFIILLSALIWVVTRDTHLALTMLVIGCPGALVIATPVAFVAGIGRAASLGILVKGGEFLERVAHVTVLGLDKTGTLTEGRPQLTDIIPFGSATEAEVLRFAAIAEQGSAHPLARPILATAHQWELDTPMSDMHEARIGLGVHAKWNDHIINVGTADLLVAQDIRIDDDGLRVLEDLQRSGKTAAFVSLDDRAIGLLAIQDMPREGIGSLVSRLRQVGIERIAMLTGDNHETATAIGHHLGLDEIHARMLPEDKLNWIAGAQKRGDTVAMVGDGINDAPALAAADVSIAMGAAGTDVALETANIALMNDDPLRIVDALRISRKTNAVVRQNLAIALGTVTLLLAGVLMREVNMAGGMMVHEASVMIVILNSLRLMRA